jgi:hypothetical protein
VKQGYRKLADFEVNETEERLVLERALNAHQIPIEREYHFKRGYHFVGHTAFTRICVPAQDLQCALVLYRTIRANRGAA